MDERLKAFERLLTIMDELRAQCPWDQQQTFETLRNLTIEETYELADAITKNDLQEIKGKSAIFSCTWFSTASSGPKLAPLTSAMFSTGFAINWSTDIRTSTAT